MSDPPIPPIKDKKYGSPPEGIVGTINPLTTAAGSRNVKAAQNTTLTNMTAMSGFMMKVNCTACAV